MGKKLTEENLDTYELGIRIPGEIEIKGLALISDAGRPYELIPKIISMFPNHANFAFVFFPGPKDQITQHFEKDHIRFDSDPPVHGLFPQVKYISMEDILVDEQ